MALAPERIFAYLTAKLPPASRAGSDPRISIGNELIARNFIGRLFITLAYDSDEPLLLLKHRDLAGLPLNAAQLFDLGLRNLEGLAASGKVKLHTRGAGFALEGGGKFDASLLLVGRVWERVRQLVAAKQLLAIAPTRDTLMLARAEDPKGRKELASVLSRSATLDREHRLNDDTYLWNGVEWSVFSSLPASDGGIGRSGAPSTLAQR